MSAWLRRQLIFIAMVGAEVHADDSRVPARERMRAARWARALRHKLAKAEQAA